MAAIPEFLFSEKWSNFDEIKMPEPKLDKSMPMFQITEHSSMSPLIIVGIGFCCCALILFLACIAWSVFLFLKRKDSYFLREFLRESPQMVADLYG
jgi:hypothetical protein